MADGIHTTDPRNASALDIRLAIKAAAEGRAYRVDHRYLTISGFIVDRLRDVFGVSPKRHRRPQVEKLIAPMAKPYEGDE